MRPIRSSQGFTVLELLVAAFVALGFSLAGWAFQRRQALDLADQSALLDATEKLRATTTFLADEVRQAGYDPQLTALVLPGFKGVSEARADRLLIQWDANGSGAIDPNAADPSAESILYVYDAGSGGLTRTVAGVTQTLVSGIPAAGFAFEYYDLLGNPVVLTGNPPLLDAVKRDLVAFIRVRLRIRAVTTLQTTTLGLAPRITLRNRILDRL